MIRLATTEDIDQIGELLKEAREESPYYRERDYHELRTKAFLHNWVINPKAVVLVEEDLSAVLVGEIQPDWLTTGHTAIIHLVYSSPGTNGIRILRAFKDWAGAWPPVDKWYVSTSFGGARADIAERVFKRLGFKELGKQFIGEL